MRRLGGSGTAFDRRYFSFLENARRRLPASARGHRALRPPGNEPLHLPRRLSTSRRCRCTVRTGAVRPNVRAAGWFVADTEAPPPGRDRPSGRAARSAGRSVDAWLASAPRVAAALLVGRRSASPGAGVRGVLSARIGPSCSSGAAGAMPSGVRSMAAMCRCVLVALGPGWISPRWSRRSPPPRRAFALGRSAAAGAGRRSARHRPAVVLRMLLAAVIGLGVLSTPPRPHGADVGQRLRRDLGPEGQDDLRRPRAYPRSVFEDPALGFPTPSIRSACLCSTRACPFWRAAGTTRRWRSCFPSSRPRRSLVALRLAAAPRRFPGRSRSSRRRPAPGSSLSTRHS